MVVFQDQHEVFFDHPLPRYQGPGSRAYLARSVRGPQELAIVSERNVFPRTKFAEKYQMLQSTVPARLVASGVIRCPDGFERYVFIYEHTLGNPLVPMHGEAPAYGMRPETVVAGVLQPIMAMLHELHNMDMAHGAIRIDNLFDGGQQPLQMVRLGDALAQGYLSGQNPLYLPPHVSTAMPSGRGLEMVRDDIYALGVTCALLMRTHDTTAGKSDEDILISKLELGTFSTLIESERLPANVLELLRGMLQDDPHARWTVQDIYEWFDGKRTARRSPAVRMKGSRHLHLATHKILMPSLLAYYAPKYADDIAKQVDSDEIRQWIRRSVTDAKLDQRYETAVESSRDYVGSPHYHERLACRLAIAMDPGFPITYQNLRFYSDSIGYVLAEMLMAAHDPSPIIDLINDQTMIFWANIQPDVPSDINLTITRFEQCQQFLKQRTIGYGIERCLYFLAPEIQCLSPSLRHFYVTSPEHLLAALNQLALSSDKPERLLDRHMIAFLSVRERKMIDPYLPDLNASDLYRQVLGTLAVLAAIQKTTRMPPMPGLSKWAHAVAGPLYTRFHDRDLRTRIQKKMNDLRDQGHLSQIADLFLTQETVKRDRYDYRVAAQEYYRYQVEKYQLNEALKHADRYGMQAGREVAALVAGAVMALAVVGFVVIRFSQGIMPW